MLLRAAARGAANRTSSLRIAKPSLSAACESWNGRLVLSEEVKHALQTGAPVIALESTIITHGMPHPTNLTTAQSLETILRSKSVAPATIALLDGKVHVGLSDSQLERLADTASSEQKLKVSRRDIASALAGRIVGGTTVASTMYIGTSVGIPMFVTGGIGGVHRGAENSMDVSADLIELGRTAMAVVCAGAKSILDIPRTLEVLETQGVCVATYGEGRDFPAFYTPSSGQKSPLSIADASIAAELIGTGLSLPTPLSTLLAVPIPSEHAQAGDLVQKAVEQAVRESVEQGIDKRGKEVTPWLLARVGELTRGSALNLSSSDHFSLMSSSAGDQEETKDSTDIPDVKLIENNARVGAEIAVELAKLRQEDNDANASGRSYYLSSASISHESPSATSYLSSSVSPASTLPSVDLPKPRVVVFGSAAMDLTSHSAVPLAPRTTTPGSIFLTPGGVGRNVAEAAHNLLGDKAVKLVSALGSDSASISHAVPDAVGGMLMREMESSNMRTDGLFLIPGERSAACTLVLEGDMDLVNGIADMGVVEKVDAERVEDVIARDRPEMVVFDCNPRTEVIQSILASSSQLGTPTFCDPTSTPKLPRIASALTALLPSGPSAPRPLTHIAPNILELDLLYSLLTSDNLPLAVEERAWAYISSLNLGGDARSRIEAFTNSPLTAWIREQGLITKAISCLPFVESIWIKSGKRGLVHISVSTTPTAILSPAPGDKHISIPLEGGKSLNIAHFGAKIIPADKVVSTTGAGDTLCGGIVAGLIGSYKDRRQIKSGVGDPTGQGAELRTILDISFVHEAMRRAERSIRSRRAVG